MRFDQLTYFETLLQEGSFNKAAAKLHITQPALTNSIKSMEKELGVTLFLRDAHGITLTDEGKKLLIFSQTVSGLYHALLRDFNHAQTSYSGNIAILAPTFFSEIVLEDFLHVFSEKYTQIHLRLIESEVDTVPAQILNTSCKFAIISSLSTDNKERCVAGMPLVDDTFFDNRFIYQPLFQDLFGICLSKNSALATLPKLYPDNLLDVPITAFRLGSAQFFDNLLLSSNNIGLHVKAFTQANAITSLPYFTYKHYFSQEDSIIWRPFSNNMSITYYLIYPVEHSLTAAEQIFIENLQNYLTQMNYK